MSDNFKNYFFATAFVLFWEFVTDDEGKLGVGIFFDFRIFALVKYLLVRIWHFCLCKAYLSDLVIFVMFPACVICLCQIFLFLWVFFCLCNVYLSEYVFSACVMFTC